MPNKYDDADIFTKPIKYIFLSITEFSCNRILQRNQWMIIFGSKHP